MKWLDKSNTQLCFKNPANSHWAACYCNNGQCVCGLLETDNLIKCWLLCLLLDFCVRLYAEKLLMRIWRCVYSKQLTAIMSSAWVTIQSGVNTVCKHTLDFWQHEAHYGVSVIKGLWHCWSWNLFWITTSLGKKMLDIKKLLSQNEIRGKDWDSLSLCKMDTLHCLKYSLSHPSMNSGLSITSMATGV